MHIIIVNHYAGAPQYGMEFRHHYLAREWVRAGHEVTIIGAGFSHVRSVQPVVQGFQNQEILEGIRYIWLKTPSYQGNGRDRILNMMVFCINIRWKFQPTEPPDVVIDSSTYPLTIYGSRHIARQSGAKLIFEVHDLWPLSPIELGGYSPRHPFIMVMQRAENDAYRYADHVVSLLPLAKTHMVEHGMAPEKFVHIPNGVSVPEWRKDVALPAAQSDALSDLRSRGSFIVCYAGAHGLANNLGCLIQAAELLKDRRDVQFVLVGQGPEKENLRRQSGHNVMFLDTVAKSCIPVLLAQMDVLYLGWKKQNIYRFGISPNKLLDYMMSGKPVIHAVYAGNDLVAESNCGLSIPPENPQAIVDAILKLSALPSGQREAMGERGKQYVESHHDYAVLGKKFLEVMGHSGP